MIEVMGEINYRLKFEKQKKSKVKKYFSESSVNIQMWKNIIYMMKKLPWRTNICVSMINYIMLKGTLTEKQEKLVNSMFVNSMMTTDLDLEQYRSNQVRLYLLKQCSFGKFTNSTIAFVQDLERTVRDWGILSFKQQASVDKLWSKNNHQIKRDILSKQIVLDTLVSNFGEEYVHYL